MYYDNKLAHFTQGAVVIYQPANEPVKIGHVVGFRLNSTQEVIVRVAFADNQKDDMLLHPVHLMLLTDFIKGQTK